MQEMAGIAPPRITVPVKEMLPVKPLRRVDMEDGGEVHS